MYISPDIYRKLIEVFRGQFGDESARRGFITPILSQYPELYDRIEWSGAERHFTVRLIKGLADHGEAEPKQQALILFLQSARGDIGGVDKQEKIDAVLTELAKVESSQPETEEISPLSQSVIDLWDIIQLAIIAVPAVRYGLGVAGLIAIIALFRIGFGIGPIAALFGAVIMLMLMVALVVFARLSVERIGGFENVILFMAWSFTGLTVATAIMLFTSVFLDWPRSVNDICMMISRAPCLIVTPTSTVTQSPRSEVDGSTITPTITPTPTNIITVTPPTSTFTPTVTDTPTPTTAPAPAPDGPITRCYIGSAQPLAVATSNAYRLTNAAVAINSQPITSNSYLLSGVVRPVTVSEPATSDAYRLIPGYWCSNE